jgi:hypothetical protein
LFKEYEIYNPPIENYHYVSYEFDCSDLISKLLYYLDNEKESKLIADRGKLYWENNYKINKNGELSESLSSWLKNIIL